MPITNVFVFPRYVRVHIMKQMVLQMPSADDITIAGGTRFYSRRMVDMTYAFS